MKPLMYASMVICLFITACKHDTIDKSATPAPTPVIDPRDSWAGNYAAMSIESHPDNNVPPNTIIDTTYCQVSVQKISSDSIRITTPANTSVVKFALADTLPGSLFYHWRFTSGDSLYLGFMGGPSHFWRYAGKKQ